MSESSIRVNELTVDGATNLSAPLPIASGGTGTAAPSLVAGPGIAITGSWPNQTIARNVVQANLTAQAANILATTLVTPAAAGFYRISAWLVITQAATSSSTLPNFNVLFTDISGVSHNYEILSGGGSNVVGNYAGTYNGAQPTFYVEAGQPIQYSTTGYLSSGVTPMQYGLYVRLEGPF
jgi:hypothetical protein